MSRRGWATVRVNPGAARNAYRIIDLADRMFRTCDVTAAAALQKTSSHVYPNPTSNTDEQIAAWDLIEEQFDKLGYGPRGGKATAELLDAADHADAADAFTTVAAYLGVVAERAAA